MATDAKTLTQALVRNKHRDVCPISVEMFPDRLLDRDYCEELANRLTAAGEEWELLNAVPDAYKSIPSTPGLYMFIWRQYFPLRLEGRTEALRSVVYVGKAGDGNSTLRSRYRSEYSKIIHTEPSVHWQERSMSNRKARLARMLNLWDLEYWFLSIPSYSEEIANLEQELIGLFNPPGNGQGRRQTPVRAVRGKPEPAF